MVKSACGIEAVYMCFNGTGIWGGETISYYSMYSILLKFKMPSKKRKLSSLHKSATGSALMTNFFTARYALERYHSINTIF